jgi:L-idonate 5-dehydrogenase
VVDVRGEGYDDWLREASGAFDVVFEASGTSAGLATCLELASFGAVVVVYGILAGDLKGVPGAVFYSKELDVRGSNGGDDDYGRALELVAQGRVAVDPVVTTRLPLERAPAALAAAADRRGDDVRVVFEPGPS